MIQVVLVDDSDQRAEDALRSDFELWGVYAALSWKDKGLNDLLPHAGLFCPLTAGSSSTPTSRAAPTSLRRLRLATWSAWTSKYCVRFSLVRPYAGLSAKKHRRPQAKCELRPESNLGQIRAFQDVGPIIQWQVDPRGDVPSASWNRWQ